MRAERGSEEASKAILNLLRAQWQRAVTRVVMAEVHKQFDAGFLLRAAFIEVLVA